MEHRTGRSAGSTRAVHRRRSALKTLRKLLKGSRGRAPVVRVRVQLLLLVVLLLLMAWGEVTGRLSESVKGKHLVTGLVVLEESEWIVVGRVVREDGHWIADGLQWSPRLTGGHRRRPVGATVEKRVKCWEWTTCTTGRKCLMRRWKNT